MKPSNFFTILLVVFIAWASLFTTILFQSHKTNEILRQDTAILLAQQKQPTTTDLNTKLTEVEKHVDCLFTLATTPHTATDPPTVLNINTCRLGSPGSASSSNTSPTHTIDTPPPTTKAAATNTGSSDTQTTQKPGFLQRDVIQPIVSVVKDIF